MLRIIYVDILTGMCMHVHRKCGFPGHRWPCSAAHRCFVFVICLPVRLFVALVAPSDCSFGSTISKFLKYFSLGALLSPSWRGGRCFVARRSSFWAAALVSCVHWVSLGWIKGLLSGFLKASSWVAHCLHVSIVFPWRSGEWEGTLYA